MPAKKLEYSLQLSLRQTINSMNNKKRGWFCRTLLDQSWGSNTNWNFIRVQYKLKFHIIGLQVNWERVVLSWKCNRSSIFRYSWSLNDNVNLKTEFQGFFVTSAYNINFLNDCTAARSEDPSTTKTVILL